MLPQRSAYRVHVLFVLGVLAVTNLVVMTPVADAQVGQVAIGIDRQNVLMNEPVTIWVNRTISPTDLVKVYCLDCPDADSPPNGYYASLRDQNGDGIYDKLTFPSPAFPGSQAAREPRWNGTYVVAVVNGNIEVAKKTYQVWMANTYQDASLTLSPFDELRVRASGYDAGVGKLRIGRYEGPIIKWIIDYKPRTDSGVIQTSWSIPREEAQKLTCADWKKCQRYFVVVGGPGKPDEVTHFRVVPADIEVAFIARPGLEGQQAAFERSETALVAFQLKYPPTPGFQFQEILREGDLVGGNVTVTIESVRGAGQTEEVTRVETVSASYARDLRAFYVAWSIPKNLTLPSGGEARLRFVIESQKDQYGNAIPRTITPEFTVTKAIIEPHFRDVPESFERTGTLRVPMEIRYRNGTAFAPPDNATQLKARFLHTDSAGSEITSVPSVTLTAKYEGNATWVFEQTFPRDYRNLGNWRLDFNGALDKWGNEVLKNETALIRLNPASMRVDFKSYVGAELRNATRGFDRGDTVDLRITIRYLDGSPFNDRTNAYGRLLNLTMERRTATGGYFSGALVDLQLIDASVGLWGGSFKLELENDITPAGKYAFILDLKDGITPTPNQNHTSIFRNVGAATLKVVTTREPLARVQAGMDAATYRFQLKYKDGTVITPDLMASRLSVSVVHFEEQRETGVVKTGLVPTWDESRREWSVTWTPPRNALLETPHVFKPVGRDIYDNIIDSQARSRSFILFVDTILRETLNNPPAGVPRGQTAFVVFDGRQGDTGANETGEVRIALQRFSYFEGGWIDEVRDVRKPRTQFDEDHLGEWRFSLNATLGQYRFVLFGRDGNRGIIQGNSTTFIVEPATVTRTFIRGLGDVLPKGSSADVSFERRPGDVIDTAMVFVGASDFSKAKIRHSPEHVNVTWSIPFISPDGIYTLAVKGRDIHRNQIEFIVGPFGVKTVDLDIEILVQPPSIVSRSSEVGATIRVLWPSRDITKNMTGPPRITVVDDSGVIANPGYKFDGVNYLIKWKPSVTTALGTYRFQMSGTDAAGNVFPTTTTEPFRLEPGRYERDVAEKPRLQYKRATQPAVAEFPSTPEDSYMTFELSYLGALSGLNAARRILEGQSAGALPHEFDGVRQRYTVSWTPQVTSPLGFYRIIGRGEDQYGNTLVMRTDAFQVVPADLQFRWVAQASPNAFEPAKDMEWRFSVRYPDGRATTPDDLRVGSPAAVLFYEQQPIVRDQGPQIGYENGEFVVAWRTPSPLPAGRYYLQVSGVDQDGNSIVSSRSNEYTVAKAGVVDGLLGIPDVAAPMTMLAFVAVALGLAASTRRRGL